MASIVIMAGGSGTRFWPKSRKNIPKQCIKITSDKPMIVETVERLKPIADDIYISTGTHLEKPIKEILPDVKYVIEPMPKNTAACIGLSAISMQDPEEVMIIETADHAYSDEEAYLAHLKAGISSAEKGNIVLIGIKPTSAHTGFGYIHQGDKIKDENIEIYEIEDFREKPDSRTAKEFLESGDYLWNSGIFISKAGTMLQAIEKHMPELYTALMKIKDSNFDQNTLHQEFKDLESISIDHGIMEKADNTVVVRGEFPWDDVGDWSAMERIHEKDEKNNIILADHKGNARNCIIIGDEKPIETDDIEDTIIVDTKDCLLVCSKDRTQEVKKIVEKLKSDPGLKKYAEDIQPDPEPHQISIDCEDIEVESDSVTATIGVDNLKIIKNSKIEIRGVIDD